MSKTDEKDVRDLARVRIREQMAQYGMVNAPDSTVDQYVDNVLADEKTRNRLAMEAEAGKMYDALMKAVTLDEKEVTPEEFGKLFRDEAPAAE